VATFGADRYLLTNNPDIQSTFTGFDITAQMNKAPLYILVGGTGGPLGRLGQQSRLSLQRERHRGTRRGVYQSQRRIRLPRRASSPNAGYTLHASGVYHFAHDIRLGVAARYQDGQHFARMVVAPDLNQGAELVRAVRQRRDAIHFYRGTLDARLQKGFVRPAYRIDALLDIFNLFNMTNEVEEVTVSGPTSRDTSAIQPPRSLHFGVRVTLLADQQSADQVIGEGVADMVRGHRAGGIEPLRDPVDRAHHRELDHLRIAGPEHALVDALLDDSRECRDRTGRAWR
jgi:hypothetical protein